MKMKTQGQSDFIKIVADRLVDELVGFLFLPNKRRNFSEHVGGMAEILEWSEEFYDLYYEKILDWETIRQSNENTDNALILDDLIIAFGEQKLKKFFAQNNNPRTYFLEKYSAIYEQKNTCLFFSTIN